VPQTGAAALPLYARGAKSVSFGRSAAGAKVRFGAPAPYKAGVALVILRKKGADFSFGASGIFCGKADIQTRAGVV